MGATVVCVCVCVRVCVCVCVCWMHGEFKRRTSFMRLQGLLVFIDVLIEAL